MEKENKHTQINMLDHVKRFSRIEQLKADGLYGSMRDPMWNPVTKQHDCCGAPRAYYHKKGCPLVNGRMKKPKVPKNKVMKWSNLLQNKCPSCNRDLVRTMIQTNDGSIACKCGFSCSQDKYAEICADRVSAQIDDAYEEEEETSFL